MRHNLGRGHELTVPDYFAQLWIICELKGYSTICGSQIPSTCALPNRWWVIHILLIYDTLLFWRITTSISNPNEARFALHPPTRACSQLAGVFCASLKEFRSSQPLIFKPGDARARRALHVNFFPRNGQDWSFGHKATVEADAAGGQVARLPPSRRAHSALANATRELP